jgi:flagellar motor switch protein FliM
LSTPSQNELEAVAALPKQSARPKTPAKQRIVHACNFRSAGRLSNEDARSLSALHETFALHLAATLDTYLGTAVEVKLETVDQLPIKDHIADVPSLSYVVPFSSNTLIVELDNELVFPIIELLLGGAGSAVLAGSVVDGGRELSEIEEEIMLDVTTLFARQAEAVWRIPNLSLVPGARIKPTLMHHCFAASEKVAVLRFGVEVAGMTGAFKLVLPTELLNVLMTQINREEPTKDSRVRTFPAPPLRERILDCDFQVSSELLGLKVAVRDLIALQPGSVLKLRAPIRTPGTLSAGGRNLFEAVPVRNGTQRAAQLGRRIAATDWKRR